MGGQKSQSQCTNGASWLRLALLFRHSSYSRLKPRQPEFWSTWRPIPPFSCPSFCLVWVVYLVTWIHINLFCNISELSFNAETVALTLSSMLVSLFWQKKASLSPFSNHLFSVYETWMLLSSKLHPLFWDVKCSAEIHLKLLSSIRYCIESMQMHWASCTMPFSFCLGFWPLGEPLFVSGVSFEIPQQVVSWKIPP